MLIIDNQRFVISGLRLLTGFIMLVTAPSPRAAEPTVHEILREARRAMNANQLEDAVAGAEQAMTVDPGYAEAWKLLGRAYMLQNRDEEALSALDHAWELDPLWVSDVVIWRAELLLRLKRLDDFHAYIRDIPDDGLRNRSQALTTRWLSFLCDSSYEHAAARLASRLVTLEKDETLSRLYRILRDDIQSGGLEGFSAIDADVPLEGSIGSLLGLIHHQRARSMLQQGKPGEAEAAFRAAVQADPSRLSARSDLGWLYRNSGRLDEAITTWREAGADGKLPRPGWLVWIADAEYEAGRTVNALNTINEALAREPALAPAIELRHFVYLMLGRGEDVRHFESMVADNAKVYEAMLRGRSRFARTSPDLWQAVEQLRRISDEARGVFMMDTYRAVAAISPDHIRTALLEVAIKENPTGIHALQELAWTKWSLGFDEEAIRLWKRAVRPPSPLSDEWMVDIVEELLAHQMAREAKSVIDDARGQADWPRLSGVALTRTRLRAAEWLLERSWVLDQNDRKSALYLALLKAIHGECDAWRHYLGPVQMADLPSFDHVEVDLLNEVSRLCKDQQALAQMMSEYVGEQPYYNADLTELMERIALDIEAGGNITNAYNVYRRIIARDSGSKVWLNVVRLANQVESAPAIDALVGEAIKASVHPSLHHRLWSIQARRTGRIPDSIMHAWESLDRNPSQNNLRAELFDMLMAEERYPEVVAVVNWFGHRLYRTDQSVINEYARMLHVLSQYPAVFELWVKSIHDQHDAVRAILTVSAFFHRACAYDHAWIVLVQGLRHLPDSRLYLTISELELARGAYGEAIEWAEAGLQDAPSPALHRFMAELSEITFDWGAAYTNAVIYLAHDPGYPPMHRLVARALNVLQDDEGAIAYNRELVSRNGIYLPAVLGLREVSARRGAFDEALEFARLYHAQRTDDPEGVRRLAVSLAEAGQFIPAIQALKPLATNQLARATPLLMYRSISSCILEGRNTTAQIKQHMLELRGAGYRFVTPRELDAEQQPSELRVMMILVDPSPDAVAELDPFVREHGIKVVLAADIPVFQHALPRTASRTMYAQLLKSDHWFMATSGPDTLRRERIDKHHTLGSPLTHRMMKSDGEMESLSEMEARLDRLLGDAARTLPSGIPPVFVYPQGNYGQLSLDCTPEEVDVLRRVVGRHFAMAIAQDESGFIMPEHDRLRLAARVVPPPQTMEFASMTDSANIVDYLNPRNPVLQAKLDMARILYWHRQYARANQWFSEAHELGADPAFMMYNWSANALQQGDLPTALARLRAASKTGSLDQDRIFELLEEAERRKRPEVAGIYEGWQDSDDRAFHRFGLSGGAHIRDDLRLDVQLDSLTYRRKSMGSEDGVRVGLETLWFFAPERWVRGEFQWLNWDNGELDDQLGGSLELHSQSAWLNGHWDVRYQRDQVPTVEAVRADIQSDTFSLMTYSFLLDRFDVYADGLYTLRTDDNDAWMLNGRILYRVLEWPNIGFGYRAWFADSDENVPEYYSPLGLEQHTAMGSIRGVHGMVHYTLSGEWGYAREQYRDWVDVWSVNAQADVTLRQDVQAFGSFTRLETPTYELDSWRIGLKARF